MLAMTEDSSNSNNKKFCIDCNKEIKLGDIRKGRCNPCYQFQRHINSPLIKCQCHSECQDMIHSIKTNGQKAKFKFRHTASLENHYHWKGGRYIADYIFLRIKGRWIREHRVIYEKYYNVCLLPWIEIHHINGDKHDNRIENLQPMTITDHRRLESLKRWKSLNILPK